MDIAALHAKVAKLKQEVAKQANINRVFANSLATQLQLLRHIAEDHLGM